VLTALLLGVAILSASPSSYSAQLPLALVLMISATLAQLFKVEAPNNQTYFATTIFLFAGVLLLNPPLFALVVVVSYLVEWVKERIMQSPLLRLWYLQPFNICTHVLAGFAAKGVYDFFAGYLGDFSQVYSSFSLLLGVVTSAVTYVIVNHLMVGLALVLARGASWKDSGILDVETLTIETILLFMGAVTAVLWTINPWLILPALSPLVLMYKALMIPQLKRDAQVDAKTGLFNARHFTVLFTAEVERAQRFGRPLSLIMADLDLLRNINNTYGHLAGDAVLGEMGRVIRETIREYDIAGRFGGEEFAIVLPEVDLEDARIVSERLREVVETTHVVVGTSVAPIHVTMSLGVSALNGAGSTLNSLLHEADVAVYHAKLRGRNCVVCVNEIPHLDDFGSMDPEARLAMPYVPRFVPRPEPAGDIARSQGG